MCVIYDFTFMLDQREMIDAHMLIIGRVLEYLAKIVSDCVIFIRYMSKAMMSAMLKQDKNREQSKCQNESA